MSDEQWGSKEIELLHGAVLEEMISTNAFMELGVPDESLRILARAVAIGVDYGFEVRWSPDWVSPGRPHIWRDGQGWNARCNDCLADSPALRTESEVLAWSDDHSDQQHSAHD